MDKLPDLIKIDDITSGKIDPTLVYNELNRLKLEINILRNDMSLFIKALATIPPNQSQQEYYTVVLSRLKTVQNSIKEYCAQYNKLLPIINLASIKLGHEVEILTQNGPSNSISNSSGKTMNVKSKRSNSNSKMIQSGMKSGNIKAK